MRTRTNLIHRQRSGCLPDDPAARDEGGDQDSDRQLHVPGHRDYAVSAKRGRRELARQMAAHESPRTTALYDRRDDEVAVDDVKRILI